MQSVQENQCQSKYVLTETFASVLPRFLTLLEVEWRQGTQFMDTEEQRLFRDAHRALGAINEFQDGAYDVL